MKKLLLIALAPLLSFASTPIEVSMLKSENLKNGTVTFKIKNNSKEDIEILKWNTPFEKTLNADIFNVENDGREKAYLGRAIKRLNATDNDYMLLQSGATESKTFQISKYYEMKKKGDYTIDFDGSFKYRLLDTIELKNNQIKKEELPKIKLFFVPTIYQKKANALKQVAKFNGCSQSNIKVLKVAHDDAIKMSKEASTAMDNAGKKTSAKRYSTWFGKADIKRQKIVTDGFNKIYDAFENKNISFDCGTCKQDESMYSSTYAYVYPNAQYQVYLCGAFWNSSTTGTDTQAGTLIHEVSHFTVIAGTNDYAYGQEDAQKLAKETPNKAVNNAENYDYFAENNPNLSMDSVNSEDSNDTEENTDNSYDLTEEDKEFNECFELESDAKMETCFGNWENKYYPMDDNSSDEWNDYDELNWDDIDWDYEIN